MGGQWNQLLLAMNVPPMDEDVGVKEHRSVGCAQAAMGFASLSSHL